MADASEAAAAGSGPGTGRGWSDAPYTDALRDALVQKIGEQQRRVASAPRSGLGGRIDRGQHQKLLLGARGTLRLSDQVPPALRHGPFAIPFELPVACRFSNGQPCAFADKTADVRGIAIKLFSPRGGETDLLATNEGGRSHASDAESFMAFADVLVAKIEAGAVGAVEELLQELRAGALSVGQAAHIGAVLMREVGLHSVRSLALESYWGSVVGLGGAAFKYSLRPVEPTASRPEIDRDRPNYLREELLSRLAEAPVAWQLCVQLYRDEVSTPVNDAAKVWSGEPIVVGALEIASPPSGDDEATIDRMAFNPGNGFEPLGITHARVDVYAASARNRAGRGLLSTDEARAYLAARG